MNKVALITGISGQDGSYLAEFLLSKGYEVHGIVRRVALLDESHRLWRLKNILHQLKLHNASSESYGSLLKIILRIKPSEIYHLSAQTFVSHSFEDEYTTLNSNINGTLCVLSIVKDFSPKTKVYFAASSEMFGSTKISPQNENTPFHPRSPYGVSKVTGYELTRNYREAYNIFSCSGILFNHESPRRGFEFVTRKISRSVARIKCGLQNDIKLGNIEVCRDWGHAKDYVEAMWLMLQQEKPDDFVVGLGEQHTVKEFLELAFQHVNLEYKKYLKIDKNLLRPAEVNSLLADYTKAKKILNWKPKVTFKELVTEMVDSDIELVKKLGY
jgi:GDPmannose 4,6-dehydratase